MKTKLRLSRVTIDGAESFEAYVHDERDWNGFVVPFFTKEQADKLLGTRTGTGLRYDSSHDRYVAADDEGEEWFPALNIEGLHVYPIGAYYWAWSEVENG